MRLSTALAAALMAVAVPAAAQQVTVGSSAQRYVFRDPAHAGLARVGLLAAPFAASIPVGKYVALDLDGGVARGTVSGTDGSTAELTGFTNTHVALHLLLAGGRLVVSVDGDAPTAAGTQTLGEARVAGVLGGGLLPFATPYWDGRGAVGGRVRSVFRGAAASVVFSGGYRMRFEGELVDGDAFVYRPGDELHLSAVVDVVQGKTNFLSFMIGFQKFSEDASGDQNLFQAGTRLQAAAFYGFSIGLMSSASIHVGVRTRGQGEGLVALDWLPGISSAPAQQLFTGGIDMRFRRGAVALMPEVELRLMRSASGVCFRTTNPDLPGETECPSGQGWVASSGLAAEIPIAGHRPAGRLSLLPRIRADVGQVIDWRGWEPGPLGAVRQKAGPRSNLFGWEVGFALRFLVGA